MNSSEKAKWDNERRWDYCHVILCLDAIRPFYDEIGIPFQTVHLVPFLGILREYCREVYLDPTSSSFALQDKRELLLRRIEQSFGAEFSNAYVTWLVRIFAYLPKESTPGWSEWKSIFSRCSVRAGWWQRLGLPGDKEEVLRREFEDAKSRTESVRDIRRELETQPRSNWDLKLMGRAGMGAEAIASGEPFSAVVMTAALFIFRVFWERLVNTLSPAELDRLWESAKIVGKDIAIPPEDVLDPAELRDK